MRYRSKPSEVEAIRWTGDNYDEVEVFAAVDKIAKESALNAEGEYEKVLMLLAGKDGAQKWVPVPVGHWLVNQPGDKSDIWPVEDAYFRAKYEPI